VKSLVLEIPRWFGYLLAAETWRETKTICLHSESLILGDGHRAVGILNLASPNRHVEATKSFFGTMGM
jgi:hypothetical protein